MSYKVDLPPGDVEGYGCAVCGAVTETEKEEYHAPNCHILEARKNAFLEAAVIAEDIVFVEADYLSASVLAQGEITKRRVVKLLREKAEEAKDK